MKKELSTEAPSESWTELARIMERINWSASLGNGSIFAQLSDTAAVDRYNASIDKTNGLFLSLTERVDAYCAALDERNKAEKKAADMSVSNEYLAKFERHENLIEEKSSEKFINDKKKRNEVLRSYSEERVSMATWELSSMLALAKTEEQLVTSRANVAGRAYTAMGDQMRRYVELHQFSGKAFAAAVTEQVKTELIGLSARASVWALFETAMGFATLMTPAVSAAHFAAAGEFAVVSAGALAGAMGVQSLLSHSLSVGPDSSGAGVAASPGGLNAAPPLPMSSTQISAQPLQNVTINIQNGMGDAAYWAALVENNIIPVLNNAAGKNITIAYA